MLKRRLKDARQQCPQGGRDHHPTPKRNRNVTNLQAIPGTTIGIPKSALGLG